MTTTYHRMVGLSVLLLLCVSGCHSQCLQRHARHHHDQFNGGCGDDVCTCTGPLYAGHSNHGQSCRKHARLRPMHRLAASVRRNSPEWMSSQSDYGCGDCGCCSACGESFGWPQEYYQQPGMYDAMAMPMSNGGYYGGQSVMQGGECGCGGNDAAIFGEQMHDPGSNPHDGHTVEAPPENFQLQNAVPNVPRDFPPSDHQGQNAPLTAPEGRATDIAPKPQDMTPMEIPKNTPGAFDPLLDDEGGAPQAGPLIDPASFEIPRMPPIPDKRVRSVQAPPQQQVLRGPAVIRGPAAGASYRR